MFHSRDAPVKSFLIEVGQLSILTSVLSLFKKLILGHYVLIKIDFCPD